MFAGMKNNGLIVLLSTMGPVGYLKAPGTMATLVTLPLVLVLRALIPHQNYIAFIVLNIVIAFFVIKKSLITFGKTDPSQIVIDEYIGCLITFCALPIHRISLLIGFLLFRFFDIVKCCGIKHCEQIEGAWGVLLDDIVAGLFANVLLHILIFYCCI